MPINLSLKNLDDFVPVHGDSVVMFYHERLYSKVEMFQLQVEFHYQMIDGDGCPVPTWACYDGRDDIPFDKPFIWKNKEVNYLTLDQCMEIHNRHPKHHYRYWWVKDWFLTGHGNTQFNREEIKEMSLGLMSAVEFSAELDRNCAGLEELRNALHLERNSRTGYCEKHGTRQLGKDLCDVCRIENMFKERA